MATAADLAQPLAWIDQMSVAMVERLVAWSGINSGTHNVAGLNAMADQIQALFSPLAGSSEQIALEDSEQLGDDGKINIVRYGPLLNFSKRADAPVQVLLTGHMDTVFPVGSHFQTANKVDDNTLHGPGVADMKGGLLVMYLALAAWESQADAHKIGWRVLINPDEETGSLASAKYLAHYAQQADLGMVYEPALADGTLAGERKGSGNFSLRVTGRSAHAGREFHLGRNAIAALAEILSQLHALNSLAQPHHEGVTLNIGRVQGGGAVNVVPDTAVAHFNVRMADNSAQAWLQERIEAIVAQANRACGIHVDLFGGFTRPAKTSTPAHRLLCQWLTECGQSLQVPVQFKATGGCCDGNNLAAAGLPNIDTLGVRGGQIHTDQEFMLIDSLAERAKLSFLLLQRVSEQGEQLQQLKTQD